MTLQEILNQKIDELTELESRIKQVKGDIAAIQRVMDMGISLGGDEPAVTEMKETVDSLISQVNIPAPTPQRTLKDMYGSFGKFLTQFLFENGLSQKEMGDLLGTSGQSVGQWMHGCVPSSSKRQHIADTIHSISSYRTDDIMALFS